MVILPSRRKNFVSQGGGGENDPYWNNVVFLSHFDTSGASRIFYDVSSNPMTVSGQTPVTLFTGWGTTGVKFGAGNINLSSTSNAAASGANDGRFTLTNQDWTVEGWFWLYNNAASVRILFLTSFLRIQGAGTAGNLTFQSSRDNFGLSANLIGIGTSIQVGTGDWHHLAVQRKSGNGTFRYDVFVDGVYKSGVSNTGIHTGNRFLGINPSQGGGNGYAFMLDDLRITTGIARYPTGINFTPPTQPYPNQ
jgi:hypothetical protein